MNRGNVLRKWLQSSATSSASQEGSRGAATPDALDGTPASPQEGRFHSQQHNDDVIIKLEAHDAPMIQSNPSIVPMSPISKQTPESSVESSEAQNSSSKAQQPQPKTASSTDVPEFQLQQRRRPSLSDELYERLDKSHLVDTSDPELKQKTRFQDTVNVSLGLERALEGRGNAIDSRLLQQSKAYFIKASEDLLEFLQWCKDSGRDVLGLSDEDMDGIRDVLGVNDSKTALLDQSPHLQGIQLKAFQTLLAAVKARFTEQAVAQCDGIEKTRSKFGDSIRDLSSKMMEWKHDVLKELRERYPVIHTHSEHEHGEIFGGSGRGGMGGRRGPQGGNREGALQAPEPKLSDLESAFRLNQDIYEDLMRMIEELKDQIRAKDNIIEDLEQRLAKCEGKTDGTKKTQGGSGSGGGGSNGDDGSGGGGRGPNQDDKGPFEVSAIDKLGAYYKGRITELETDLQKSKTAYEAMRSDLEGANMRISELEKTLGDSQTTIANLREELEAANKNVEDLKRRPQQPTIVDFNEIEKDLKDARQQIQISQEESGATISSLRDQLNAANNRIEDLERRPSIDDFNEMKTDLETRLSEFQQKTADESSRNINLRNELQKAEEEINKLKKWLGGWHPTKPDETAMQVFGALEDKIRILNEENETLNSNFDNLDSDTQQKIRELQEKLKEYLRDVWWEQYDKKDLNETKETLQNLRPQNEKYYFAPTVSSLKDEIQRLKDIFSQDVDVDTTTGQVPEINLESRIRNLKETMTDMEKRLREQDQSLLQWSFYYDQVGWIIGEFKLKSEQDQRTGLPKFDIITPIQGILDENKALHKESLNKYSTDKQAQRRAFQLQQQVNELNALRRTLEGQVGKWRMYSGVIDTLKRGLGLVMNKDYNDLEKRIVSYIEGLWKKINFLTQVDEFNKHLLEDFTVVEPTQSEETKLVIQGYKDLKAQNEATIKELKQKYDSSEADRLAFEAVSLNSKWVTKRLNGIFSRTPEWKEIFDLWSRNYPGELGFQTQLFGYIVALLYGLRFYRTKLGQFAPDGEGRYPLRSILGPRYAYDVLLLRRTQRESVFQLLGSDIVAKEKQAIKDQVIVTWNESFKRHQRSIKIAFKKRESEERKNVESSQREETQELTNKVTKIEFKKRDVPKEEPTYEVSYEVDPKQYPSTTPTLDKEVEKGKEGTLNQTEPQSANVSPAISSSQVEEKEENQDTENSGQSETPNADTLMEGDTQWVESEEEKGDDKDTMAYNEEVSEDASSDYEEYNLKVTKTKVAFDQEMHRLYMDQENLISDLVAENHGNSKIPTYDQIQGYLPQAPIKTDIPTTFPRSQTEMRKQVDYGGDKLANNFRDTFNENDLLQMGIYAGGDPKSNSRKERNEEKEPGPVIYKRRQVNPSIEDDSEVAVDPLGYDIRRACAILRNIHLIPDLSVTSVLTFVKNRFHLKLSNQFPEAYSESRKQFEMAAELHSRIEENIQPERKIQVITDLDHMANAVPTLTNTVISSALLLFRSLKTSKGDATELVQLVTAAMDFDAIFEDEKLTFNYIYVVRRILHLPSEAKPFNFYLTCQCLAALPREDIVELQGKLKNLREKAFRSPQPPSDGQGGGGGGGAQGGANSDLLDSTFLDNKTVEQELAKFDANQKLFHILESLPQTLKMRNQEDYKMSGNVSRTREKSSTPKIQAFNPHQGIRFALKEGLRRRLEQVEPESAKAQSIRAYMEQLKTVKDKDLLTYATSISNSIAV